MFKDERRCKVWDETRQLDLRAFVKFLTPSLLGKAAQAAGVRLRSNPLNWANMVWLGIAAALHTAESFCSLLVLTFRLLENVQGWSRTPLGRRCRKRPRGKKRSQSKHDPHGRGGLLVTEEAFVEARKRMPIQFWMWLLLLLGEQFQSQHPKYAKWKGFRLLAMDGTELALQRDARLAKHFGTSRNGKRRRRPQARMLMLAFPLARVPWRYELAPRSCHEQTMAARLLTGLAARDLVLMDRGFWSFGLFWTIQRQQAFFGIRLRRGVKMKCVQTLGRGDAIRRWTPSKQSKQRCRWKEFPDVPRSLDLRVIRYQVRGFRPSAVVTNVLDPKRISADDWVRLATQDEAGRTLEPGLYHRRWEIETLFCELKVRQGMKKLRSRTPEGIAFEVAGHVLLYLLTRWLMVEAAEKHGIEPLRISFTNASRELEHMREALLIASPERVACVLLPRLCQRIAEHVVPSRPGRHYPRPADKYKQKKYRQAAKTVTYKT
jgi:hypothetical protein